MTYTRSQIMANMSTFDDIFFFLFLTSHGAYAYAPSYLSYSYVALLISAIFIFSTFFLCTASCAMPEHFFSELFADEGPFNRTPLSAAAFSFRQT